LVKKLYSNYVFSNHRAEAEDPHLGKEFPARVILTIGLRSDRLLREAILSKESVPPWPKGQG
jgi:hypothetical protein